LGEKDIGQKTGAERASAEKRIITFPHQMSIISPPFFSKGFFFAAGAPANLCLYTV
jgi:hypothetical protein